MKMYDLQRVVREFAQVNPQLEIPLEKNIDIPNTGGIHNSSVSESIPTSKSDYHIPWGRVMLVSGFVIGLVYLLYKFPKNDSYQSFTQRRLNKAMENN